MRVEVGSALKGSFYGTLAKPPSRAYGKEKGEGVTEMVSPLGQATAGAPAIAPDLWEWIAGRA